MSGIALVQEQPWGPQYLIEIPVSQNGVSRVALPEVAQLRSTVGETVIIQGIRLITVDVQSNGVISGFANAPLPELPKLSLTLYAEGWEKGQAIPLLTFNDMIAPGSVAPYRYNPTNLDNWKKVDWTKSFLQYANNTVSAGAPYVVMLQVQYIKINDQNQRIEGPQ